MSSLQIIYEDEILLVVNKPSGLMVEPDRNNFPNLKQEVINYLKEKTGEKLPYAQHLHRLDRVSSGLVLFTKQKQHLRNLSEQFAKREVKKTYLALTDKAPKQLSGYLEHFHRKEKGKAVLVPQGTEFSEQANLDYECKAEGKKFLWTIQLHSGKFHQIRVQLASLGCPIIGDELYGSELSYQPNAIALHATRLAFKHPVTHIELIFEVGATF